MRFKNYLNEQYRYSREAKQFKNKANKIVKKYWDQVIKDLSIYNFDVSLFKLCMVMSSLYYNDKIRFIDDVDRYIKNYKYIKGSDFYKKGDIEIFLTKETPEHLKKLWKKGEIRNFNDKFFKELIYVLSNTMVHVKRIQKMKDDFTFIGYNPIKKHIIDHLDFYAREVVFQLQDDNFSPTRSLVHDLIGQLPKYKTFLNLIEQYKK